MRCLAVCQDELVIRMLDQILAPSIEVDFLVESRALARKLQAAGLPVNAGDIKRTDTYIKAESHRRPASSSKTPAAETSRK